MLLAAGTALCVAATGLSAALIRGGFWYNISLWMKA